nr:winged helix-turn-helix domain-containing protein [Glycomyces sp. TRM65418]
MLGPFEVRTDDGASADVPGDRLRALLIALALEPRRVVQKATLVDWIWGEHPPADAANALQRLVSRLRKTLPDGVIEGRSGGYRLLADPDAVDAVRFERLVAKARNEDGPQQVHLLREALGLWRGAPMQEIGLQDGAAFDAAITRLEGLRLSALEDRFDAEVDLGDGADLVTELTDLVAAHPMRERLVGALMRALAAAGRGSEALLVYERTRESLADALGVDPSPELAALHVALLRGELAPPPKERPRPKTNLRAELTSFVGRDADVAVVGELLAEHRLTTLVGPGGAGKTRLATETARSLLGGLPDGAWLVELAAIGPDGDVAQASLAGLGLRDSLLGEATNAEPTDRIIAAIRERDALLILDNCEHVIDSAAAFADRLLGECRNLRILATSREPLGITGEALWLVDPLALPEGDAGSGEIEASPAVRLLRDRAAAVRKDLAVDARTLARVCRALDGMPLAIELAAAKLRTMSLDQLANRLDDRFRLLTGGSRTALPRHKTLRAVVDWSWELLTDAERAVLRRLGVFSGGASLEAAERVCADDGAVRHEDVLDLLTALAEKSLLLALGDGEPRYRMLGTIKEYALRRLEEAGETDRARRAHLAYYTGLVETAEPQLRRADQLAWLAALEAEHDDIAAAMRGAIAAGETQAAMRLAASAGFYWWLSGHKAEGSELVTAAATMPGDADPDVRGMVYTLIITFMTAGRGGERQAEEWIHEAYRCSRAGTGRYPLLALIAPLEQMLRDPSRAMSAWEALLDEDDPWVRAMARLQLGKMRILFGQGGPEAETDLEAALDAFRALGDRFGVSFAQSELADRIAAHGDLAAACERFEQAIAAVTAFNAVEDAVRMQARQAQLYWLLGDRDAGAAVLADAERSLEGVTWPDGLVELALAKAELARWDGDAEEARRQIDDVKRVLGDDVEVASVRATIHGLLGYLADDIGEARAHLAVACEAAAETGIAPLIAQTLVAVADLAVRRGQHEQAAQLLAAGAAVRGTPDRSQPDPVRIEQTVRERLGDERFDEATGEGAQTDWSALVAGALAD